MLDKHFTPGPIEDKWYRHWEQSGAFDSGKRPDAEPYCIVIPPPNVTGSLHIGHALNNTLQDVLARFERLRGKDVLWQPGTDHAGIATQMVVERNLASQGVDRRDIGRQAFLDHVWEWKAQSGDTITRQLRRLGASCDWRRERFTMDDGLSAAVTKVFVGYYEAGLLYKAKRLVNWDPKLKTAISDLEVENREVPGHFWHFRYPLEDGSGHIAIATTRPETILGDGAVAVHPDDSRYRHLVGKRCRLPIVDRLIPIITDPHVEMDFGSGAVKITAAHDHNDYEVYQRHPDAGIPLINLMHADASMNDACPPDYRGLDRYEARTKVVADFDALGLLDKVEDHVHTVPYGDRSGVVIEPWLTDQWYVDAEKLATAAIAAVEDGRTRFHPKNWEKTFYEWMRNIQPWCVSRQLWWGHQIPAWYTPDGEVFVAEDETAACAKARAACGEDVTLTRDEDVLDTWFSSALWPFSTLGWPDDNDPALARFYPTATLVTAFDIIFFWVARMMMSGLYFMDEVPFKDVYITSLVRDAQGKKMSKTVGNVIDPLEYIDAYGADALRFTLIAMESQGRDIKLAKPRIEGYRNFATKLWNAARFCEMYGISGADAPIPPTATTSVNRWIIGETAAAVASVTQALENFRFDAAADAIYHFAWHNFCDWYLELIKPALQGEDCEEKTETMAVAGWVLDQILITLHPFMPFITEELWHALAGTPRASDLICALWPDPSAMPVDETAQADVAWAIEVITSVRAARADVNVPAGAQVPALIQDADAQSQRRLEDFSGLIKRLARLSNLAPAGSASPDGAIQIVVGEALLILPLADVIDLGAERARLAKSIDKAEKEVKSIAGRLANPGFLSKAPDHVVAENKARLAAMEAEADKLKAALARLSAA